MHQIDDAGLDFALLRVFQTVLETKHVTRAAEQLGLTQSATSHALSRLRRAFDDELFVRGPKGVLPTQRALALAPQVHDVLARLEVLTTTTTFDPAKLVRRFSIGGGDFAEIAMLPRLLPQLRADAPGVDLAMRMTMARVDDDLATGVLDLALGVFPQASASLVTKKLFDEGFVTLLRKGHPALDKTLTVRRWAALDHILITPRGSSDVGIVDEVLAEHGLRRRVVVQTATFSAAPLLVENSDCVTTMPARMAAVLTTGREVVVVPTPVPLPRFSVMLAFHERSRGDPAHAWLRDQISAIASTAPFTSSPR